MTAEMSGSVDVHTAAHRAAEASLVALSDADEAFEDQVTEQAKDMARRYRELKVAFDDLEAYRGQINAKFEELTASWRGYTARVYGEQRELAVMLDDPVEHVAKIAYWRQDESRSIDADRLLELAGQQTIDAVTGKPKVVAAKFDRAVETGLIPLDVAAAVCTITPKAGYIAFATPDRAPGT